ncbi:MAG: RNA methyltransferase [Gammaproteobacteria bacterium]|nr:RNA methyltransferase [Gammaproteobacteria bacterium]
MLENIRVVLVRTFHPGNIGAAARSMKTMGLSDLYLVAPKVFPSEEATKMAAGAADVVENATIVDSLAEAIEDCTVVIASTARPRGYDLPCLSPEQTAAKLNQGAMSGPVALIFGPERMGLHNDDIRLAKYRVTIPANPNYGSLNMAAAVQTLSYEIYKSSAEANNLTTNKTPEALPTSGEVERLYVHLEEVLKEIRFLRPHQGETMHRIRHLINRAQISQSELNIVRGILSAIQRSSNPSQ